MNPDPETVLTSTWRTTVRQAALILVLAVPLSILVAGVLDGFEDGRKVLWCGTLAGVGASVAHVYAWHRYGVRRAAFGDGLVVEWRSGLRAKERVVYLELGDASPRHGLAASFTRRATFWTASGGRVDVLDVGVASSDWCRWIDALGTRLSPPPEEVPDPGLPPPDGPVPRSLGLERWQIQRTRFIPALAGALSFVGTIFWCVFAAHPPELSSEMLWGLLGGLISFGVFAYAIREIYRERLRDASLREPGTLYTLARRDALHEDQLVIELDALHLGARVAVRQAISLKPDRKDDRMVDVWKERLRPGRWIVGFRRDGEPWSVAVEDVALLRRRMRFAIPGGVILALPLLIHFVLD